MRIIWCIILTVFLLSVTGCSKQASAPPQEGKPAPDFTLKDMDGRDVHLKELQGKVVMVNFWATWCPPCRGEIPSMVKLNTAMAGKPFQMLAISIDEGGVAAVADFFARHKSSLPTLLDTGLTVSKMYGTTGVPETFLVDKKGIVVKKVIGAMDLNDPQLLQYLHDLCNK